MREREAIFRDYETATMLLDESDIVDDLATMLLEADEGRRMLREHPRAEEYRELARKALVAMLESGEPGQTRAGKRRLAAEAAGSPNGTRFWTSQRPTGADA